MTKRKPLRSLIRVAALSMLGISVVVVGGGGSPAAAAPHTESPPIVQFGYTDSATPDTSHSAGAGDIIPVEYNSVPTVDNAHLYNGGFPCAQLKPYPRIGEFANRLEARGVDADTQDERKIRTIAAVWPENDPNARAEFSGRFGTSGQVNYVTLPDGILVDGQTYVWQARVTDGVDTSAWSKKCFFTYDVTRPSTPTVQSNYPTDAWSPVGVPATFTFSGNGDEDVAGFQYAWWDVPVLNSCGWGDLGQQVCPDPFTSKNTIHANISGGTATVTLDAGSAGPKRLAVHSIDTAGNASATAWYEVRVSSSSPQVELLSGTPEWGKNVRLKISPARDVTGVYRYDVTIDGSETNSLSADDNGVANLHFIPSNPRPSVKVRSYSENGFVSEWGSWSYYFSPTPAVASADYPDTGAPAGGVGMAGTFMFSPPPGVTDVVAYQYLFDDNDDPFSLGERVDVASEDGRASITWTPKRSGDASVTVYAIRANGQESLSTSYSFKVA